MVRTRSRRQESRGRITNLSRPRALSSRQPNFKYGGQMRVSKDPTPVLERPWYPYTLWMSLNIPGAQSCISATVSSVCSTLLGQLGLSSGTSLLNVRFNWIKVWGDIIGDDTPMHVTFYEPGVVNESVETLSDLGTSVNRKCVGYRFPEAWRANGVSSTSSAKILSITHSSANDQKLYIQLNVNWRVNISPCSSSGGILYVSPFEVANDQADIVKDDVGDFPT